MADWKNLIPGYGPINAMKNVYEAGKRASATSYASGWNESSWLPNLQSRADNGDQAAIDALVNYYSSKEATDKQNRLQMEREDTYYQRLVEDLRKAGISPYVLSAGGSGSLSYAKQVSTSTDYVSRLNAKESANATKSRGIITALAAVLGIIVRLAI